MKTGPKPVPLAERFQRHFTKRGPDECWPWTGGTAGPYGKLGSGPPEHRTVAAHVVALELATGEASAGRCALHSCDFTLCVNPGHLRWGTQKDNIQDAVKRGRHFSPFRKVPACTPPST